MSSVEAINGAFDRFVVWIHGIEPWGIDIHPYLLFLDSGVVASFAFIFIYSTLLTPINTVVYSAIFLVIILGYENVYTEIKAQVIDTPERNFPLDALVYMLPVGLVLAYAAGLDIDAVATLAAMQLGLSNGFTRLGCFSGGCCYGKNSRFGVRYPAEIFVQHDGLQDFSPGTNPNARVFPCQLLEAGAQFLLFTGLFLYVLSGAAPSFALLVVYLCGYSVVRFLNDFTRQYTHRPTYGPLTEGQVLSLIVLAVGGPYLLL
jgi:phosphatidylglycerol:prolipoprotein diacylglycerol transferase